MNKTPSLCACERRPTRCTSRLTPHAATRLDRVARGWLAAAALGHRHGALLHPGAGRHLALREFARSARLARNAPAVTSEALS